MDQAVYEWLLQFPQMRQLSYQFGEAKPDAVMLLYDNETLLQLYQDGAADRKVTYIVAPFAAFSKEAFQNIDAIATVRSMIAQVQRMEQTENYPAIDGVYKVEAGDISIAAYSNQNRLAKYRFPLFIYYEE